MPNVGVRISELESLSGVTNDDLLLILDRQGDYYFTRKITAANVFANYVTLDTVQTITGTKTFHDVNVEGTLVATSAVFITTETLAVSSNWITLNNNVSGIPFEDAGIEVNRGLYPPAQLKWDESADAWFYGISGALFEIGSGTGSGGTELSAVNGYTTDANQILSNLSGEIEWVNTDDVHLYYATIDELNYVSGQVTLNDADIAYVSGQVTDLTAVSGYDITETQTFTHVSGVNHWDDVIGPEDLTNYDAGADQLLGHTSGTTGWQNTTEAEDLVGYDASETQVLGQLSGAPQWLDPIDFDAIINETTITAYDPTSGALTINLSGTGAYTYTLNGDSSFTVINAEATNTKNAISLLTATTDLSASFDSTWKWPNIRPTNDEILITSGSIVELIVRSHGSIIIAAYGDLV